MARNTRSKVKVEPGELGDQLEHKRTGPRGGTTTRSDSGMVKKNLWIPADDAERLRVAAFEQRTTEAELMRQGITAVLDGEA